MKLLINFLATIESAYNSKKTVILSVAKDHYRINIHSDETIHEELLRLHFV